MALTRKLLKGMGLTDEQVDSIIDAHVETVNSLKDRISELEDGTKAAEDLRKANETLQKKIDDLTQNGTDAAKVQADFDAYKKQIEDEKANSAKEKAVRDLLKANGVQRDSFIDLLIGKVDLATVEMDGGNVKDADSVLNPLKTAFADCFGTVSNGGVDTGKPLSGGKKSGMTREEIMKIEDYDERLQAIKDNMDVFGYSSD